MDVKNEEFQGENPVLRQLRDMFPSVSHWRLRDVCETNNWNLELCIDKLMNVDNTLCTYEEVKLSQEQFENQNKKNKRCTFTKNEERIGTIIKNGFRVMILMRGPPGVGKSYLAQSLVNNFVDLKDNGYSIQDFVCSADDYFYNANGVYVYNAALLSDAHEFNQQKVCEKTKLGLSPIIVDNTNMQLWEMLPYVKFAVQNNYLVEILEPQTPWRNSTSALAQKNKHGVPQIRIQQIMDKYEKCSVVSLTRMLKNTKYTKNLPQLRSLPPFNIAPPSFKNTKVDINDKDANECDLGEKMESKSCDLFTTTEPKEQRIQFKFNNATSKSNEQEEAPAPPMRDVYSLLEQKTNIWKPFETESAHFWGIASQKQQRLTEINNKKETNYGQKSLLDLLKEDIKETEITRQDDERKGLPNFERHSINCLNENPTFVTLRQIYPNKRVSGLWDLFVKCNGDVDWAIDILLKEDEMERNKSDDTIYRTDDDDAFECLCNKMKNLLSSNAETFVDSNLPSAENDSVMLNIRDAKPQRQRPRFSRSYKRTNPALLEVKENIENCFVLGDDQYSEHLLKIRNFRSGLNVDTNAELYENIDRQTDNSFIKNENEDDDDDEDNDSDVYNEDMLEMSLGEQLIQQLVDTFRNESSFEEQISSTLPVNIKVFMPRSLAKQLYMLWVESAYNHMEEERQKLIQEDEDFARLLKNPKYSEFKQSPSNLHEILDMEYAWKVYNQEKGEKDAQDVDMEKINTPNNLALHLTQMKLCETFPDIPRETLLDVFTTNGFDYNATVAVLRSTMQIDNADGLSSSTQNNLMEYARQEQERLDEQVQNQLYQLQERASNNWDENELKSSLSSDEEKRLALRDFEESRNLAAHHCQLKAECYQKAKEAIQSGNSGAAIYYSQIANLHKKKIDMYNHRAANCIMDVHKYTQNNPELLDLHYLHLLEALGCLDLFLDRHITGLRVVSRAYKHVFIITGRGKHSAGGVSTIKNKVKSRLKERCLRWSEVNPGLLKVKVFSGSRLSKNI